MTRPALLAAAALASLLAGTFMPSPLYDLYRRSWQLSPGEIGAVFAVYVGALVPALLVIGGLSDRVGRRPVLLGSLGLMTVSMLVLAAAQNVWWLIAARLVQGLAMGLGTGAAAAAMREWLAPGAQARSGALVVFAASFGSIAGAVVAGVLGEVAPDPLRLPYLAHAVVLVAVGALLALARIPPFVGGSTPYRGLPRIDRAIRRPFAIVAGSSLLSWAAFAILSSLVPSFVSQTLALHSLLVGSVIVTALQLGSIAAAATRLPPRRGNVLGLTCGGIGVLLLIAAVPLRAPLLLAAATLVTGFGGGLTYLNGLNIVGTLARADRRAELNSAYFVACYLGFSIPALLVGIAANRIGLPAAIAAAAAVLAALSVLFAALSTERNLRPAPQPA